jgi:hypothetical protein
MKRHYFVTDNLDDLQRVEQDLQSAGITPPQFHVLSDDDTAVETRNLREVEAVLKRDVVHGTERGAVVGLLGAVAVLALAWLTGLAETYTWVPAIFLAIVVMGFCTWEGGLIGIQEPHVDFKRFTPALKRGKHVLLVDVDPGQERALEGVVAHYESLRPAGEGSATPRAVVRFQDKWHRFMQLAP